MKHLKLVLILFSLTACGQGEQAQQSTSIPFKASGDMKQTMEWVLDPAADHLWGSSGSIITAEGTRELAPTTEEEWMAVRHSALVVAETGNLLLMPSRTREGAAWQEMSRGLIEAGLLAEAAAKARDSEALFEAGAQLYRVCKSCHGVYIHDSDSSPETGSP